MMSNINSITEELLENITTGTPLNIQPPTISQLNEHTQLQVFNNETPHTCSICHSQIEQNSIVRHLHCNHIFHANCIDQWFSQHINCPLCRQNITENTTNT